ncbi:MAG: NAD-dependent epimerase/dehydratase family protein, partial [Gemmatimonadaceae bacterium]
MLTSVRCPGAWRLTGGLEQSDGRRRIVVTGANGFIGRHVCESLVASGHSVVGLARGPASIPVVGVKTMFARDVMDGEAIRRSVAGATTIIHLAARVHAAAEGATDPVSECRRVNVDGTRLLIESAIAAGVPEFVFMSSVKAVASESDEILTADTPPQPSDAYGQSKLEAERLIRALAVRHGMHAPILRLPLVYGPGIKANMLRLFAAVDAGVPLPLGSVKNRRSFAHVANVSAAIASVMAASIAAHETFYVSDGHDLSTPDLMHAIAASLGRNARLIPFPETVLRSAGRFGDLLSRIAPFNLTSDSIAAVVGSLFVDSSKLRDMTGFRA